MEEMSLRKLSKVDGMAEYQLLQTIGSNENRFTNPVHDMNYDQFKNWLIEQEQWSRGENLPCGFVGQTIYWLDRDGVPVGLGKIRHKLTEQSRQIGGSIGYAIGAAYRGCGYGEVLLRLLIPKARELHVDEILLTVEKNNPASKRAVEKSGGILFCEDEERWFFRY